MLQNPHAEFDLTVLEMIEHSPTGAVPHTPTYQDALKRLHATQQVYAHADFKDGHVTARSLGKSLMFHAANLDDLIEGRITADELEANARIYDRYVQSLSVTVVARAEALRLVVAGRPAHHRVKHDGAVIHDPMHMLFLVPGAGAHPGLPGNYLYGFVHEMSATAWSVHLHDSDDGASTFTALDLPAALAKLQEVLASAPFHLDELEALGFTSA